MGGGGRADGSPLLGDLGDAEAGEGIGAGGQGGDGSADPTRCLAEERWTVTGVLADGVTERGNAALGGLESEGHARPELSRRLVGIESPVVFCVARMVRHRTDRPLRISSPTRAMQRRARFSSARSPLCWAMSR